MLTRRLATALGCVALAVLWVASARAQQPPPPMTAQEKVQSWKGERVVLLGSIHAYDVRTVRPDGKFEQPSSKLATDTFRKPGVVVDASVDLTGERPRVKVRVALDDGQQVETSDLSLGFDAELEQAKALVGKTLWTRGPLSLFPIGSTADSWRQVFTVPPAHMVKVTSADWGQYVKTVVLRLDTGDGREGLLYFGTDTMCFNERFHVSLYNERVCAWTFASSRPFFEQDPHTLYPKWSKDIWALIESGTVAIGMNEKMLDVLCGENLTRTGAVVDSETGSASSIYACAGKEFLVEKGVVNKYITKTYRE